MQSNSYKLKYFKYKTKYLNLLKEIYNKEGGTRDISILDSAKKEKSLIKGETTAGVTSAINGKLGIAKDVKEGTAGNGKLCNQDSHCPEGEICVEGNCEKEPPKQYVKKLSESERLYEQKLESLRRLSKQSK